MDQSYEPPEDVTSETEAVSPDLSQSLRELQKTVERTKMLLTLYAGMMIGCIGGYEMGKPVGKIDAILERMTKDMENMEDMKVKKNEDPPSHLSDAADDLKRRGEELSDAIGSAEARTEEARTATEGLKASASELFQSIRQFERSETNP